MTLPTNTAQETSQSGSGARILLVDDEPDVLVALTGTLRRAGYCVRTASNAERGLETLSQEVADVLITDVIMPSRSGVDVVKQVRALYPSIRIIAISGGGNFGPLDYQPDAITTSAYLAACEHAGAHAVLAKPFEAWEILAVIHQVLGH
jgi:DNA-binding NtrC family response regulator